jgi:two-component sensor histidine kinase
LNRCSLQIAYDQKRIYSLTLVFWGGLLFSVFTILFITQAKRKKAESQLLKSHDKLEKRVKARTLALSTTNRNLKSEIHKKKIAQKELIEERGQMISIFESIDESIYVSDLFTYEILYVNHTLIKEFKKDPTGGICYKEFQHLDAPCSFCTNSTIIKQKYDPYTWEYHNTILKKDFIITNRLIQWPDGRDVRFELAIDITSRKIAEENVATSLKEKETLLYEIHHRVKNNLAVISSLLGLQAIHMKDDRLKDALNDSRNRIQAMATIHETLHQSDNLAYIDMNSYLSNLATTVFANYRIEGRINLEIDTDKILMETNHASPVGLLINELISNSLKYAFPENQRGLINIQLKKSANDQIELIYTDNGIGIPENINWKKTDSLGLQLVKTIVQDQLDGGIELKSDKGTCFIIKFEHLQNKGH